MLNFNKIITFAYDNEYDTAYDLKIKKNFSTPKIYNAKGDLTKRWYVYFSFRDPETGKLKRMTPIYGDANSYKTKEDRLQVLTQYRKTLIKLLNQGFSPFENNTESFNHLKNTSSTPEEIKLVPKQNATIDKIVEIKIDEEPKMSIKEAFDFSINYKTKLVSVTTIRSYKNRIDYFLRWLSKTHPEIKTIDKLTKKVVLIFLNAVLDRTTARTRNNYRTELSSIIQVLEDNEIIKSNFIKKISVLKSTPNRNKTYSQEEQESIFKYLEQNDKVLLLFIKFISYNFLRPIEVCRLQIKDINIKTRTVQFKAKNSPLKTKIIPDLLWKELPDLTQFNPDDLLFARDTIGGAWDTKLNNRRDFYSKRFKTVVKKKFNLGIDYGLYSFRHTYITKLYRAMVKDSSPFEAKSKLMLITGHSTMSALEKYLRDIDAELPADYSEMLKNINE
ncbi:site-specific integrase [uncultured Lacinutrix sp.]|uniref:tyrosine-type recombinase/integrase n=1 Tax=uncultured Lacinutrix sp. TaxID=574032 RepID=UPI00260325C5|nr:site-specific integrase [uncultured Lacinutrix sp.]